jgi:repressor LexA
LTQEQVAELSGGSFTQRTVSSIETGVVNPLNLRSDRLLGLLSALQWSLEDLTKIVDVSFIPNTLQPGERVSKLRFFIEPVRGLASAGQPVDADGMPVLADVWRRGSLLYQVEGDSMAPTLNDGDRVYVDPTELDLREGRVYVFDIPGNGHTIKRVRRLDDGELWLVSDNPKYRPWRPSEMRVIGRVYYHDPAGGRL